ncbi:MAG: hypothetical protein ACKODH_16590 [Limisphaerales bacterium]
MKLTDVDKFLALRESLTKEKAGLEARLAAINRALGAPVPVIAALRAKPGPKPGSRRRGKRAKNTLSMKEAAVKAVTGKSLSRHEVLKAILALGYKFTAKDPLNSLSSLLYSDKSFKNTGGKFSVAK